MSLYNIDYIPTTAYYYHTRRKCLITLPAPNGCVLNDEVGTDIRFV